MHLVGFIKRFNTMRGHMDVKKKTLHKEGSVKVCSSTFCAAACQLPLMLWLDLACTACRTGWNNGRGLLNAASHIGNYVRMFVLYTHVVCVWISYES